MAEFTENDTALLREIAHSYKLPGYPEELRQRGADLLERVAKHLDQQRTRGVTTPALADDLDDLELTLEAWGNAPSKDGTGLVQALLLRALAAIKALRAAGVAEEGTPPNAPPNGVALPLKGPAE